MVSKGYTVGAGPDGSRQVEIHARGMAVLDDPQVNRGTAFTMAERDHLGLHGLLPAALETLEQQVARCYEQFKATETDVEKWAFLTKLHDSNEVLFYRLVGEHVHEMLPIVYTPTVGAAIQEFSHLFRRPRGVFLNIEDVDGIDRALDATGLGAGRHRPGRRLRRRGDPRHRRLGRRRDRHLDRQARGLHRRGRASTRAGCWPSASTSARTARCCSTTRATSGCAARGCAARRTTRSSTPTSPARRQHFPKAILHWEDFSGPPARRILARYGDTLCTFDDDIQGTAAVGLACVLAGRARLGRPAGRPADRGLRRRLGRGRHRRPDRARHDRGRAERRRRPPTGSTCSTARVCSPAT